MSKSKLTKEHTINIGIIGCISAGKSTLLNAIFGKCLSDMKIKRTTMVPQIYHLKHNDIDNTNIEEIINTNQSSNKSFCGTVWDGTDVCNYNIKHPSDFINLNEDFEIKIYDIPGINDQQTKDIYMKWLKENISDFNFIIYTIDINSALNTSDEIEILDVITSHIEKNTHLICLINKCDNQVKENNVFRLDDEELEDIIETQIKPTIDNKLKNKFFNYILQTFSSQKCFLYRTIQCNDVLDTIIQNFDPKHIEAIMVEEVGKSKWNRITQEKKEEFINKKLLDISYNKDDINIVLNNCGYYELIDYITNVLTNNSNFYIDYYMKNNIIEYPEDNSDTKEYNEFYNYCNEILKCSQIKSFIKSKNNQKIKEDLENNYTQNLIKKIFKCVPKNKLQVMNKILDEYYKSIILIENDEDVLKSNKELIIGFALNRITGCIKYTNLELSIEDVIELLTTNTELFKKYNEIRESLLNKFDFSQNNSISTNTYLNYVTFLHSSKYINDIEVCSMLYDKMDILFDNILNGLHTENMFNNDFDLGTIELNNYAGLFILQKQIEINKNCEEIKPIYHKITDLLDLIKYKYNLSLTIKNYKDIFDYMKVNTGNIFDDIFMIILKDENNNSNISYSNNISLEIIEKDNLNQNDTNSKHNTITSSITGWFTNKGFYWK